MNKGLRSDAKRVVLVVLGSALFSFNVNTFVHTAGLFPGGFAGIALLLQAVCERFFGFHLPYAPVSLLLNAFPVYISFRFIGRKFTLLSCLSILLTSILTDVLPGVQITSEPVLVSIFGGMINGAAIGMCLLADATSGGTDFISIYLSEQHGKDDAHYAGHAEAGNTHFNDQQHIAHQGRHNRQTQLCQPNQQAQILHALSPLHNSGPL